MVVSRLQPSCRSGYARESEAAANALPATEDLALALGRGQITGHA
jgi:hypothetical protein